MNQHSSVYPNGLQSIGATVIVMLISVLLALLLGFIEGDYMIMIQYSLPLILAFFYLRHYQQTHSDPIPTYTVAPGSPKIYPLIIVATLSILVINGFLASFIPMPDMFIEIFEQLAQDGIFTVITVAIAAPILEELIFRGVILNGLLKNYDPVKAILISSFLFGALHLNPWQFIAAFNLGILAGWVFYRTNSIIPAIAVHFVNNGTASLLSYLEEGETEYNIPPLQAYGDATTTLIAVGVSALLVYGCVILLNRTLPTPEVPDQDHNSDPEDHEYSK